MAGVFLSYDREDADKARPLAQTLEKAGHEVWWDLHVRGGAQFSKVIEEALKAADAVVVLWSAHSVESAWVRDEAAAGRDTGRLIPVALDGVTPPLGFRQFQTIDLSRRDRRKTQLQELLVAVASYSQHAAGSPVSSPAPSPAPVQTRGRGSWFVAAGAIVALLLIGAGWWKWSTARELPLVEVAAADASPNSQAAASDLFVKLGTLAEIGKGKWQLVQAAPGQEQPDLLFRTADTGSPNAPKASLVLLDANDMSLLWSREFSFPAGGQADLRQQLSLTAGRVLGCALETRANGGLKRDLLKIFLDGCAEFAEIGANSSPDKIVTSMRSVLAGQPRFLPAWERLLSADVNIFDLARSNEQDLAAAKQALRNDMIAAAKVAPDLPQITMAQTHLLPPWQYGRALELFSQATARAPENAQLYADQALVLMRVGRMDDAVASARRAAELDPLSPSTETQLILALAYAGATEAARRELERAEKLWAGTSALRDAQFAFHLRYGDPKIAAQLSPFSQLKIYLNARTDPSPANVEALLHQLAQFEAKPDAGDVGYAIQALGEFHRTDDVFRWLGLASGEAEAEGADILFRPALADVRRDPRFMAVAKRLHLVDYWQASGKWPDFCKDRSLPYDCKAEAAKLA